MLKIVDLAPRGGDRARRGRSPRSATTPSSTPYFQRPLELGIDVVVALDHQVPERPLRRGRRRSSCTSDARARRADLLPAERGGRRAGADRQLPRAARPEDAARAHGAPRAERAGDRRVPRRAPEGRSSVTYPGLASHPQHALAAQADEGLRRDAHLRDPGRPRRRRATFLKAVQGLRLRRVARRRREPHRAPGDHDPRLRAAGDARQPSASPTASSACRSASRTSRTWSTTSRRRSPRPDSRASGAPLARRAAAWTTSPAVVVQHHHHAHHRHGPVGSVHAHGGVIAR